MKPDSNTPAPRTVTKRVDWIVTIVPFICILVLCSLFMALPEASSDILSSIRFFLGDQMGSYYLILGLGAFICSLYMAFSRFGKIRLGDTDKPQYSGAP